MIVFINNYFKHKTLLILFLITFKSQSITLLSKSIDFALSNSSLDNKPCLYMSESFNKSSVIDADNGDRNRKSTKIILIINTSEI